MLFRTAVNSEFYNTFDHFLEKYNQKIKLSFIGRYSDFILKRKKYFVDFSKGNKTRLLTNKNKIDGVVISAIDFLILDKGQPLNVDKILEEMSRLFINHLMADIRKDEISDVIYSILNVFFDIDDIKFKNNLRFIIGKHFFKTSTTKLVHQLSVDGFTKEDANSIKHVLLLKKFTDKLSALVPTKYNSSLNDLDIFKEDYNAYDFLFKSIVLLDRVKVIENKASLLRQSKDYNDFLLKLNSIARRQEWG